MSILFDTVALIQTAGYVGIWAILFAESGLFIGVFLPGDSLLFTAGVLASQGFGNIWTLILVCFSAAVLGDSFGYAFGYKVGHHIFNKENSIIFNKEHLVTAQEFYEHHGGKTIIFARFMPFVRTFAPILAGVGKMPYKRFFAFNVAGGALWGVCLPLIGYWLGKAVPQANEYIFGLVILLIILSFLPQTIMVLRSEKRRRQIFDIIRYKILKLKKQ